MEKILQPCDKDRMRMAMLKHEETFRQQVYELHRLYRIQKMLMDEQERRPIKQESINPECHVMEGDDEGEIELSLSLGLGTSKPRKTDKSESGQSTVSSSSTGSSQTRKTSPNNNDSVRFIRDDRHHNNHQFTWGSGKFPQGSGSGPEPGLISNGHQSSGSTSTHPAWLFQALSLKMT